MAPTRRPHVDTVTDVVASALALVVTVVLILMAHHVVTTPITGHATPVPLAVCVAEDGSTDGQVFPCMWDATKQGNRMGQSYVLFVAA